MPAPAAKKHHNREEEADDGSAPPPYLLIEKRWDFKQVRYFLLRFVLTQQYVLLSFINFLVSSVLALFYTQTNSYTFLADIAQNNKFRAFFENIKRNLYMANRDNASGAGGELRNTRQNFVFNLDYILFLYVFVSLNRLVLCAIAAIENVRRETDNRRHLIDHVVLENSANCQRYLALELEKEEEAFRLKNKKVMDKNDKLCPAKNYGSHEERRRDERYELAFVRRKKMVPDVVDEEESLYYFFVLLFAVLVFFILAGVQLQASNFFKGMVVIFPFIHVLVLFMILKVGNANYNKHGNPLIQFVSKALATRGRGSGTAQKGGKQDDGGADNDEKKKTKGDEEVEEKYFYYQRNAIDNNNNNNNNSVVYRVDKMSIHRLGNQKLKYVQFYCFLVDNTVLFFTLVYFAVAVV